MQTQNKRCSVCSDISVVFVVQWKKLGEKNYMLILWSKGVETCINKNEIRHMSPLHSDKV